MKTLGVLVIALAVGATTSASADLILTGIGVAATEDFETYTGAGFDPNPAAGELDSDDWRTEGMSDGDTTFGGTFTSGDHAQGSSTGGETTGGFYSFDTGGNNEIFGWQPTGPDYTPGAAVLRLQNDTGTTLNSLEISYDIYVFNNADRANTLNFAHSDDDIAFTDEPSLDFTTPQTDDPSAVWESTPMSITLTGLSIPDGGNFFFAMEHRRRNGIRRTRRVRHRQHQCDSGSRTGNDRTLRDRVTGGLCRTPAIAPLTLFDAGGRSLSA